jgi:hypothetical protein
MFKKDWSGFYGSLSYIIEKEGVKRMRKRETVNDPIRVVHSSLFSSPFFLPFLYSHHFSPGFFTFSISTCKKGVNPKKSRPNVRYWMKSEKGSEKGPKRLL